MREREDKALEYTTKLAMFLCSQNMTLDSIYDKCNIKGDNKTEKFHEKFSLFNDRPNAQPSNRERFYADVREVKDQHASREGGDLFVMTMLTVMILICIAMIVVAPYAAAGIAAFVAISEIRKPLMLYFIVDASVGLLKTLGYGALHKIDREDEYRDIFRNIRVSNNPKIESLDQLKDMIQDDALKSVIDSIYKKLTLIPKGEGLLDDKKAYFAEKLIYQFAKQHQGLRKWFFPWATGREG